MADLKRRFHKSAAKQKPILVFLVFPHPAKQFFSDCILLPGYTAFDGQQTTLTLNNVTEGMSRNLISQVQRRQENYE